MSHTHVTTVTRRLGAAAAAALVASAVWTILAAPNVAAQGMPTKTCVDPRTANQVAQPGDTLHCTVSVAGSFIAGQSFVVQPTAPAGAAIPHGGCSGASGSGYTTTASDNRRLGSPAGACIYTVSGGTLTGNGVIGTELVAIPANVRAGSSLTQQTQECLIAETCGPMMPMIADGPGSCVSGPAIPVLGGCDPQPAGGLPPGSTPPSGVAASSTTGSLPFTAGPVHPLPVAPAGIALAGAAVALVGALWPSRLLRRRRSGRAASVTPHPARSRRRFRGAAVLTGLAGLILGNVLAVQFMQTPALLLEPRQVGGQAVRAFDAMRAAPRAGLWIEAPTLGIELPVRDGDGSARIPDWMALHYPGTPEPGQPGDSYLYAHGFDGMFGPLLFARYGSPLWLRNYTTGWSEAFRVTRVVGSVAWNDTAWLRVRSSTPMLTLQTCVGADMHGDRWVVEAAPSPATR